MLYKNGFIGKLMNICLPFIIGFIIAYLIYPLKKKLDKKIPNFSIIVIVLLIFSIGFIFIKILIPIISSEGLILYELLKEYYTHLSIKYNLNFISKLFNYDTIINGISISISYVVNFIISLVSFIYFLSYMDNIKSYMKKYKIYNYLEYIHNEITKYVYSLFKISVISFFEYTIVFLIIGHKNFLLVGILAGILNMIPYFGGIITIFLTILLDPSIIVRISITYLFLGLLDGYIITPIVYGKYNKINPLLGLFVMSLSTLFKIPGIILSIPFLILIKSTISYIKENKIDIKKIIKI